nr:MAG TPA: hypothetical protein [Caudoviricetes sp.]
MITNFFILPSLWVIFRNVVSRTLRQLYLRPYLNSYFSYKLK